MKLLLKNRDEFFRYLLVKLLREFFAVRVGNRSVAEIDDGGKFPDAEEAQHVIDKNRLVPPADGFARRNFAIGRFIRDRAVGNRQIRAGGEFEKRRVERQHFLAFGARAFGKIMTPSPSSSFWIIS